MANHHRKFIRSLAAVALVAGIAMAMAPAADAAPKIVKFEHDYPLGSIVVVNTQKKLYYVIGNGQALQYSIAIGVKKEQWTGKSFVQSKAVNPSWTPPDRPGSVVPGGIGNPLGVRALYLGWTLYRIHGTNKPSSIGSAASNGCFRMLNKDVIDLYERVKVGTKVVVI